MKPNAFISYSQAAFTYGVSARQLSRLTAAGTLTRHVSNRDRRKVLLSVRELTAYFHGEDTPATHPAAAA